MKPDVPFEQFGAKEAPSFDMNEVAGKKDILFICLDTLRYDAAKEEEEKKSSQTVPVPKMLVNKHNEMKLEKER